MSLSPGAICIGLFPASAKSLWYEMFWTCFTRALASRNSFAISRRLAIASAALVSVLEGILVTLWGARRHRAFGSGRSASPATGTGSLSANQTYSPASPLKLALRQLVELASGAGIMPVCASQPMH